jgi:hypothetical protein
MIIPPRSHKTYWTVEDCGCARELLSWFEYWVTWSFVLSTLTCCDGTPGAQSTLSGGWSLVPHRYLQRWILWTAGLETLPCRLWCSLEVGFGVLYLLEG